MDFDQHAGGTSATDGFAAELARRGVVAVLRTGPHPEPPTRIDRVVQTLLEAGVTAVEFTLTSPDALACTRRWSPRAEALVGVGSVTTVEQVRAAVEAGARFVVSPGTDCDVITEALHLGVPSLPGVVTPTEVQAALAAGAQVVKLFPAGSLAPAWATHLRGPFPGLRFVPTGGISLDDIADWVRAGAVAVGLGGPLVGDALDGGSFMGLADRARRALDAVERARSLQGDEPPR